MEEGWEGGALGGTGAGDGGVGMAARGGASFTFVSVFFGFPISSQDCSGDAI